MNRDSCNISYRLHIPDLAEQLCFCKYAVRVLCQKSKEIKFLGRKCFFFSIYPDTSRCLVYLDATDFNNIILYHTGTYQSVVSLHMCFYSGHQFTRTEWLGHIIIRAKTESTDLINIIFLCRYHNDRDIFLLTYLTAYIKPIYFRKHQIQYNQIIIFIECFFKAHISSVCYLYFKSGKFQIILLQICNCFFIFDDQYFTHFIGTS